MVGRDGQVSTAGGDPAAGANPDLPPLKWNSPLLRPENFNVPYKQDPAKPQSTSDIARIEKTFRATIARLVREGRRLEGTGNGVMNNIWVTFRAKDGARCYEQSEALLADLAKEFNSPNGVGEFVEPRGRWHFKMTTYFGEGHEANGHYWVTATSREPGDPTLILDPWKGEIEKVAEKKPIVTKGYASYWFGYVMDKTVGQ
ncbi:MAG: hypothetical protein HY079_00970 [Elusimicrobia bacterium]|nr:hypothetical protein [Elusimicrobiota bacterium]